jgi:CRP-like cAMP-binding protein
MTEAPKPEQLQRLNRLESLTDAELKQVVTAGRQVRQPAGWALISEGTPADKAYLIVDGEVSVRRHGQEVARLGPGDVIGEVSIVEHKLRTASVVSLTPLEVVHFTREAVEDLIEKVPAFGEAIRATAAERLAGDTGEA